jgi:hypothetical protein
MRSINPSGSPLDLAKRWFRELQYARSAEGQLTFLMIALVATLIMAFFLA